MHTLRTPRLTLRPLTPSDRPEFLRVHTLSWPTWSPWMPSLDSNQTFDDLFTQMLARIDRELSAQTGLPLAAFLPDGSLVGFFSIFNIVRGVFHSASAGWRVSADHQRQGYALESLTALLTHAFSPEPHGLSLHRIQANIIPTNTPSLSLAQRAGFRHEGYALRYLKIANQWQDHIMLAKLADEHSPQ